MIARTRFTLQKHVFLQVTQPPCYRLRARAAHVALPQPPLPSSPPKSQHALKPRAKQRASSCLGTGGTRISCQSQPVGSTQLESGLRGGGYVLGCCNSSVVLMKTVGYIRTRVQRHGPPVFQTNRGLDLRTTSPCASIRVVPSRPVLVVELPTTCSKSS